MPAPRRRDKTTPVHKAELGMKRASSGPIHRCARCRLLSRLSRHASSLFFLFLSLSFFSFLFFNLLRLYIRSQEEEFSSRDHHDAFLSLFQCSYGFRRKRDGQSARERKREVKTQRGGQGQCKSVASWDRYIEFLTVSLRLKLSISNSVFWKQINK